LKSYNIACVPRAAAGIGDYGNDLIGVGKVDYGRKMKDVPPEDADPLQGQERTLLEARVRIYPGQNDISKKYAEEPPSPVRPKQCFPTPLEERSPRTIDIVINSTCGFSPYVVTAYLHSAPELARGYWSVFVGPAATSLIRDCV